MGDAANPMISARQVLERRRQAGKDWVPAFAGMIGEKIDFQTPRRLKRSPACRPERVGRSRSAGGLARNRNVAPCFRVTGTGMCFRRRRLRSARPVHASCTGAGFNLAACGACGVFPPRPFRRFHPCPSYARDGRKASRPPGPRGFDPPGSPPTPRPRCSTSRRYQPRKGPGSDSGTTFPAQSHPAAR